MNTKNNFEIVKTRGHVNRSIREIFEVAGPYPVIRPKVNKLAMSDLGE